MRQLVNKNFDNIKMLRGTTAKISAILLTYLLHGAESFLRS
jgi:hypothetical protein